MIFPTKEEGKRVYDIIDRREDFEDLTPDEMFTIRCMYECLDLIEEVYEDFPEESTEAAALQEVYDLCAANVADVYVSLIDNH